MAVTDNSPRGVASAYFAAVARRDPAAMGALWAPGGVERIHGQAELHGGDAVRDWFTALFAAFPDLEVRVVDLLAEHERVAVHWRGEGTFAGAPLDAIAPTGDRVTLAGIDLLRVREGRIVANDAYLDGLGLIRGIGLLPAQGSAAERGLTALVNTRARAVRRLASAPPRRVADGVWVLRGGLPGRTMNVFAIEDAGGGITFYDAGIRSMTRALAAFGAARGGVNRVVLGHAHADHRGAAPGLGAPVLCHLADRADAERPGDPDYFDFRKLRAPARHAYPRLLRAWDGGATPIAGTVAEGDDVSGFQVVHVPGHAPGMVALVRERDGLALTSDAFYVIDPETTLPSEPRVPHEAFNQDTERARASLRRLADIPLRAAWPGHGAPVTGDVRRSLLAAAGAA